MNLYLTVIETLGFKKLSMQSEMEKRKMANVKWQSGNSCKQGEWREGHKVKRGMEREQTRGRDGVVNNDWSVLRP